MTTRPHHCHAIDCGKLCPPKHLMCSRCWRLVPPELAAEVYRTVHLRSAGAIDATWAPWWRAAHRAIDHVYRHELRTRVDLDEEKRASGFAWADRTLAKDLKFADDLETL